MRTLGSVSNILKGSPSVLTLNIELVHSKYPPAETIVPSVSETEGIALKKGSAYIPPA